MTPPEELNVILLLPRPALDSPQLIVWVEVLAPLQRFPARSQPRTDRSPGWPPTIWHEVPRFPRVDGWLDAEQPPEWREFLIEYFTLNSCLLPPPDLTDWQTSLHNNSQHQLKALAVAEWRGGGRGGTQRTLSFFYYNGGEDGLSHCVTYKQWYCSAQTQCWSVAHL